MSTVEVDNPDEVTINPPQEPEPDGNGDGDRNDDDTQTQQDDE